MQAFVRFIFLTTIQFFYRQISVRGRDQLVTHGPVLVVANHPNGLLDPLIVRVALNREVGFMGKAPLFENPLGKLAMDSFAALPVYRAKDGRDTKANEKTFAAVDARFAQQRWVVIFPEGHSHSEPTLQPVKTGAARMSLASEAARDFTLGLHVQPVGLVYEAKEYFRSRVSVVLGTPIAVAQYAEQYREDAWAATEQLTQDISHAIADLILNADDSEVWHGLLAVARWTDPSAVTDVDAASTRAKRLAAAYRALATTAPEEATAVVEDVRAFVAKLAELGVDDPFNLEPPIAPPLWKFGWHVMRYAIGAPFAALGWALNALPYYGIAPLAVRIAGEDTDIISTVKLLAGLLFYPLTWSIEAAIAAVLWGAWAGALVLIASPVLGLVAVSYFERLGRRRDALRGRWLRATRADIVESVIAHRRDLTQRVTEALSTPL